MAKLQHPEMVSVSWNGKTFEADDRGVFEVPEEAVGDLQCHGLTVYVEPKPQVPQIRPVPQWSNDDLKTKAAELGLEVEGLDRPTLIQAVTTALRPKD